MAPALTCLQRGPIPAEPNPHPPSRPPLHHPGAAPDTLPSPCFPSSSSSGGFAPGTLHKALSVSVCPSYSPSLCLVPGADISPGVSSSAFLCLQHHQDSCLGIPRVFLNFLLSGHCKNSFGLLIPIFIDYVSPLWFYHSPARHLAPGPVVTSTRVLGLQQARGCELPITWRELLHCLSSEFLPKRGFAEQPTDPLAAAGLRRVVAAAMCADSRCLPVCPSSPFLFPPLPSFLCFWMRTLWGADFILALHRVMVVPGSG